MIQDKAISKNANIAKRRFAVPLISAISQTDKVFWCSQIGHPFEIEKASVYAANVAGTVSVKGSIVPKRGGLFVTGAGITVHSTPEQLALALLKAVVNNKIVEKAAATGITFTAAHKVTATKYGAIAIDIDNAGTVSSAVVGSPQAYADAGSALAAVPAVVSTKIRLATILIKAGVADWTANTDDMTAASDLSTIAITNTAAEPVVFSTVTPVALTLVEATLSTTPAAVRGAATDLLLLYYNTDGSGVLTNATVNLRYRNTGLNGEGRRE